MKQTARSKRPKQENKHSLLIRQNDPNLCRLDLLDSMGNADVIVQLGNALRVNTHLRRLDFAVHRHWTLPCAQAMAAGIQHSNIRALWITLRHDDCHENNNNNDESWYHLLRNLRHDKLIQQLTFVSTPTHAMDEEQENILGQLVSSLASLQLLSLLQASSCQVLSLAQGLRQSSSLIRLELCDTNLSGSDGATSMALLSMGLSNKTKPTVKFVRLESNHIDDMGVAAFVEHWSTNPTHNSILQELCLARNKIGATGVHLLIRVIAQHHPKLKYLMLDDNINIGYVGLEQIGHELGTLGRSFTRLSLRGCVSEDSRNDDAHSDRDDDNTMAHNHNLAQRAYDALLHGLQANVYLRELSVVNNALLNVGNNNNNLEWYCLLNQLGRYLLVHQSLSYQLSATIWCHVLFQCNQHQNASAIYFFLREQPHLVSTMDKSWFAGNR